MIKLLDHLKFILPAIGTNETRKNIMWVKCWVKNDYLHMMAANGYVIKTIRTFYGDNSEDSEFYIDLKTVENAIKIAENSIYFDDCHECESEIFQDEEILILENKIIIGTAELAYKNYEMDYPDLDHVINSTKQIKNDHIFLNMKFLELAINSGINDLMNKVKIEFLSNDKFIKSSEKQKIEHYGFCKIDFLNKEQFAFIFPIANK